jgi:TetR/AcrR family transcriptional regulator, regulator of autoinduction and epiphytic fitness
MPVVDAMAVVEVTEAAGDGRVARGERTRRALAEAMIALIEEGEPRPTARQVAERAGVSLRLVFHHFADLEAVLRAAVEIQERRHWRRLGPVDPAQALSTRLASVVRQRAEVFEAVAPVRRSAQFVEHQSPIVATQLGRVRRALRRQLADGFAPELARFDATTARTVLDALDVALGWESWDQLRRLGRTVAACRRTMETMAGAVLSAPLAGDRS